MPLVLLTVFVLLLAMFGDARDEMLVFTGIPFALTGGVSALWLRGTSQSILAALAFSALLSGAVLNRLVMLSFIRSLRDQGIVDDAVREGAPHRLRAVLMVALAAPRGFVPPALVTGTDAEVQRPWTRWSSAASFRRLCWRWWRCPTCAFGHTEQRAFELPPLMSPWLSPRTHMGTDACSGAYVLRHAIAWTIPAPAVIAGLRC